MGFNGILEDLLSSNSLQGARWGRTEHRNRKSMLHSGEKSQCSMGKPTINGHFHPFSIAMLNYLQTSQQTWQKVLDYGVKPTV